MSKLKKTIQHELVEMAELRGEGDLTLTQGEYPTLINRQGIEPEWVKKTHAYWQSVNFQIVEDDDENPTFDDGCCRGGCNDYCCRVRG